MTDKDMLVLVKLQKEIEAADNYNTVNKLYRQARLWARFQYVYAEAWDKYDYDYVIEQLKNMRNNAKLKVGDV